LSLSKT